MALSLWQVHADTVLLNAEIDQPLAILLAAGSNDKLSFSESNQAPFQSTGKVQEPSAQKLYTFVKVNE